MNRIPKVLESSLLGLGQSCSLGKCRPDLETMPSLRVGKESPKVPLLLVKFAGRPANLGYG